MAHIKVKPSEFFLLFAGIIILASLPLLMVENVTLWNLSKVLYGIGVVLYLIDR